MLIVRRTPSLGKQHSSHGRMVEASATDRPSRSIGSQASLLVRNELATSQVDVTWERTRSEPSAVACNGNFSLLRHKDVPSLCGKHVAARRDGHPSVTPKLKLQAASSLGRLCGE